MSRHPAEWPGSNGPSKAALDCCVIVGEGWKESQRGLPRGREANPERPSVPGQGTWTELRAAGVGEDEGRGGLRGQDAGWPQEVAASVHGRKVKAWLRR